MASELSAKERRIAILGAGPIGLEAALYARRLKLPVTVFERGRVGEHLHRWGHVRLFTPFAMNSTTLGRAAIRRGKPDHKFPEDDACSTGREHLATYLTPLSQTEDLRDCIRFDSQVLHVGRRGFLKDDVVPDSQRSRQPFRLLLRDAKNRETVEEAHIVLDCTGTYAQHRWLGDGGTPAQGELSAETQIAYGLEDILGERKSYYVNKTTLVVGGGFSAASAVCQLNDLAKEAPAQWVIWLTRAAGTQPLRRIPNDPLRERDRLAMRANTLATRDDDNVEFHAQSFVDSVEFLGQDKGFRVRGRCSGQGRTWDVDRIIGNVGYSPDTGMYRELHVQECFASLGPAKLAAALSGQADGLKLPSLGAEVLRNPEPNFYLLGAKSFGRNSQFLLRTGFDQVRDVFGLITGDARLDLYKKA